jgi:hypothetical protein
MQDQSGLGGQRLVVLDDPGLEQGSVTAQASLVAGGDETV